MQSDKKLIARSFTKNHEGENNFEDITIYVPKSYDDDDALNYIIQLNVINKDNVGDVITLTNPSFYKDRYKYEFPIPLRWTVVPGKISMWLKFLKDGEVVGFTNEACAYIYETKEIADYIPEQSLSLLDEWTLEMNKIKSETENITSHPPIIGKNGNWFTYSNGEYIDSGIKPDLGFSITTKDDYWIMFGKESQVNLDA